MLQNGDGGECAVVAVVAAAAAAVGACTACDGGACADGDAAVVAAGRWV